MSRYGLLGMALVIATFVLVLLVVAPKPNDLDASRRLAHFGAVVQVYTVRHDGELPPDFNALAREQLLAPDALAWLSTRVKFVAAGRPRDTLGAHGIVALEDPAAVIGSIRVAVLLSDGAVLSVPADVVREAGRRIGDVSSIESGRDGQLCVVFAADAR